jgi:hypothetical protein
LFAQNVSGAFRFDSLADLQAGRANQLVYAAPIGDGLDSVRALFSTNVYTFGLQDTWDVSDNLTVTYGARWDVYQTPDTPAFNKDFQARTGFRNNASLNGRQILQPRFAASWHPTERLQLRASGGLYAGGNPNVWISNNYSNPGPTLGSATVTRTSTGGFTISGVPITDPVLIAQIGAAALNNVTGGTGVPASLANLIKLAGSSSATTNELDPNFKIPSQWRVAGTVNYTANFGALGDDWNLGADVVWSRVKDALIYRDLRSVANTVDSTLPDGRPRYQAYDAAAGGNQDLYLTNTSLGYSWNIVARVDKRWTNGFSLGAAYTFQRSKDVNPGTSSTAGSNYGNSASVDPNVGAYGISNYQVDDAYRLTVGYDKALFGDNKTTIQLFFNSRAGQHYSYTVADLTPIRSAVFGTVGSNSRYLMYVPNVSSETADPNVTYAPGSFASFKALIEGSVLNKYQGQIAPKNIGRSPRFNKLDLSVRQELPFVYGGKFEAFADVENLLNLINNDWGSLRQVGFPYFGTVANVSCVGGASPTKECTQYVYSPRSGTTATAPEPALNRSPSLWQIRVGARVKF